jgi:hypothetical protein
MEMLNCLIWWGGGQHLSVVKLTILTNPQQTDPSLKLCRLRALSQPSAEIFAFIEAFKEKLDKVKGSVPSAYLFEPNEVLE